MLQTVPFRRTPVWDVRILLGALPLWIPVLLSASDIIRAQRDRHHESRTQLYVPNCRVLPDAAESTQLRRIPVCHSRPEF